MARIISRGRAVEAIIIHEFEEPRGLDALPHGGRMVERFVRYLVSNLKINPEPAENILLEMGPNEVTLDILIEAISKPGTKDVARDMLVKYTDGGGYSEDTVVDALEDKFGMNLRDSSELGEDKRRGKVMLLRWAEDISEILYRITEEIGWKYQQYGVRRKLIAVDAQDNPERLVYSRNHLCQIASNIVTYLRNNSDVKEDIEFWVEEWFSLNNSRVQQLMETRISAKQLSFSMSHRAESLHVMSEVFGDIDYEFQSYFGRMDVWNRTRSNNPKLAGMNIYYAAVCAENIGRETGDGRWLQQALKCYGLFRSYARDREFIFDPSFITNSERSIDILKDRLGAV